MEPLTASSTTGVAFTCLVPVHAADDADHFAEAMRSIARSTLRPTEVLIAQDGDLSAALAAEVAACLLAGARLTRNPGPRGLQHNLNYALSEVRTPWLARADADDINLPERFALQARFVEENPEIDVLGGGILEFWPDGRQREKRMPLTLDQIVRRARWRNPINHMTAFARVAAITECGGYPNLDRKEDYGLWLTMIGRGRLFANLDRPLVRARLGGDFYERRSGRHNLESEVGLYRIKRSVPRIGAVRAWLALAARAAILTGGGPARFVYERALRR